jgi:hypothetical protein
LGYKIKDIKGDGLDSMSFIVNIWIYKTIQSF